MDRRQFLRVAGGLGVAAFTGLVGLRCGKTPAARIEMPPLPYPPAALEPHISARTVELHYGRHHRGYVEATRRLVQNGPFSRMTIPEIVRQSAGQEAHRDLFNQAAQAYNHAFYWDSMSPEGGGDPEGELRSALETAFGSLEGFHSAFREAAGAHFGSGWAWLVVDQGQLSIVTTGNADTPMARGIQPLLCLDLWEHAYYLDYQHRRDAYVRAWLEHLVQWAHARRNFTPQPTLST